MVMRTRTVILLTVLLLVASASAALAKNHAGRAMGPMAREMDERDFGNLSASARDAGLARAEAAKHFARWNYSAGNATGRFVSFMLNESTGVVNDFTLRANNSTSLVFSTVAPDGFTANGTARATGAVLHLVGQNASFSAHNNPVGLFQWRAEGAPLNVSFALGAGANASVVNGTVGEIVLGGVHGHLVAMHNATLNLTSDNRSLLASLPDGGAVIFLGHPTDAPGATANLHAFRDGLAQGKIGAMTTVVDAEGKPLENRVSMGVTARTHSVGKGHANLTISAEDGPGKAVVIHLDGSIIPAANASRVNVTVDGARAAHANSLGALLAGSNATNASVFVNRTDTGVQVVVWLPHFSDHEVSITTASANGTTIVTPTVTATPTTVSPTTTSPTTATPTGSVTPTASPTTTSPTPDAGDNGAPGFGLVAAVGAIALAVLVLRRRS